jgi:hypothetical protein
MTSLSPCVSGQYHMYATGGIKWPTEVEKNKEISCFEVLDVLF